MNLPHAMSAAESTNVVALNSVRRHAAHDDSTICIVPADRPAPPQATSDYWLALFFLGSLALHIGLGVVFEDEPEPLPSIGVVSLSVELVAGTDLAAGRASTLSATETAASVPSPGADVDARLEPALEPASRADTPSWLDQMAAFRQVAPPREQAAQPARPPQIDAARPSEQDDKQAALAAVTGGSSIGRDAAAADATYPAIVAARLARFKQYPTEARKRGQQGSATVTFTLDGNGSVVHVELALKSGNASLDRESLAMVRRAAPFPPTPTGGPMSFTVPVNFSLR
jgi:periplasmic protein TonB